MDWSNRGGGRRVASEQVVCPTRCRLAVRVRQGPQDYPYTLDALLQVLEEARLRSFNEGPQVITVVTGRSSQGEVSRQGQPGFSGELFHLVANRDQVSEKGSGSPITHRPRILSSPDVGAAERPVRGVSRQKIKAGQIDYIDVHLSHVAQTADESFVGALNFAIVEAVGIT